MCVVIDKLCHELNIREIHKRNIMNIIENDVKQNIKQYTKTNMNIYAYGVYFLITSIIIHIMINE